MMIIKIAIPPTSPPITPIDIVPSNETSQVQQALDFWALRDLSSNH
jgi:hypothetical protein